MNDQRDTCDRLLWVRGEDRRCGQSVGVVTYADHTGRPHVACPYHIDALKRRYPEALATSVEDHGTLDLTTPWARGAFGPNDRITVANEIPPGWTLSVSVSAYRSWVILRLLDPHRVERARGDRPLVVAVAAATGMAQLAQTMEAKGPARGVAS